MPTTYTDQFFQMDPGNPPAAGTALTKEFLDLVDANDNNTITANQPGPDDTLDGQDITAVWPGDTITVTMNGVTTTITGTTFYLADGRSYFTPTDGTNLDNAVFQSSSFVTSTGPLPVGDLGPPCFVEGSMIETDKGEKRVETLCIGDLVLTKDAGFQPIIWIGQSVFDGSGDHAPVVFDVGAIGNSHALRVSPQHRVLIQGWMAELVCGQDEVLASAKHMANDVTIRRAPQEAVTYFHILLPRHHLVRSHGCWSESFFPGDTILADNRALAAEMQAHISDHRSYRETVRPTVNGKLAQVLTQPVKVAA